MPTCVLTSGRVIACKDYVGGVREIFFSSAFNVIKNSITFDAADQITDFDAATLYRYEVKDNQTTFVQTPTVTENGTIAFEQVLTIYLGGMTAAQRKELILLARNRRLAIFVRDNNDSTKQIQMMGYDDGAECNGGGFTTGAVKTDDYGWNLTFRALTAQPAYFVEPYTALPFDNIANATISPAYE